MIIPSLLLALCVGGVLYYGRKAKYEEMRARPWFQRVVAHPVFPSPRGLECSECGALVSSNRRECPRCGTM